MIYNTGTVTVTNGSHVVTGSGTTWSSLSVPLMFAITDGSVYECSRVVSDTEIWLSELYAGASQSGATYVLADVVIPNHNLTTTSVYDKRKADTLFNFLISLERRLFSLGKASLFTSGERAQAYRSGYAYFEDDSTTVSGYLTNWLDSDATAGYLKVDGDPTVYRISDISSDTSLILTEPYSLSANLYEYDSTTRYRHKDNVVYSGRIWTRKSGKTTMGTPPLPAYDSSTYYNYGNIVLYDDEEYIYINSERSSDNIDSTTYWRTATASELRSMYNQYWELYSGQTYQIVGTTTDNYNLPVSTAGLKEYWDWFSKSLVIMDALVASMSPSSSPSASVSPSLSPSTLPTSISMSPSASYSESPSVSPSGASASRSPSGSPSGSPSASRSSSPSSSPSESISGSPSMSRSLSPSISPSASHSSSPSNSPSSSASVAPHTYTYTAIDMIDSIVTTDIIFVDSSTVPFTPKASYTEFDPSWYDGDCTFYFEVVSARTISVSSGEAHPDIYSESFTFKLIDVTNASSVLTTISVGIGATDTINYNKIQFTPSIGTNTYAIEMPLLSMVTQEGSYGDTTAAPILYSAKIGILQENATKLKLSIPLSGAASATAGTSDDGLIVFTTDSTSYGVPTATVFPRWKGFIEHDKLIYAELSAVAKTNSVVESKGGGYIGLFDFYGIDSQFSLANINQAGLTPISSLYFDPYEVEVALLQEEITLESLIYNKIQVAGIRSDDPSVEFDVYKVRLDLYFEGITDAVLFTRLFGSSVLLDNQIFVNIPIDFSDAYAHISAAERSGGNEYDVTLTNYGELYQISSSSTATTVDTISVSSLYSNIADSSSLTIEADNSYSLLKGTASYMSSWSQVHPANPTWTATSITLDRCDSTSGIYVNKGIVVTHNNVYEGKSFIRIDRDAGRTYYESPAIAAYFDRVDVFGGSATSIATDWSLKHPLFQESWPVKYPSIYTYNVLYWPNSGTIQVVTGFTVTFNAEGTVGITVDGYKDMPTPANYLHLATRSLAGGGSPNSAVYYYADTDYTITVVNNTGQPFPETAVTWGALAPDFEIRVENDSGATAEDPTITYSTVDPDYNFGSVLITSAPEAPHTAMPSYSLSPSSSPSASSSSSPSASNSPSSSPSLPSEVVLSINLWSVSLTVSPSESPSASPSPSPSQSPSSSVSGSPSESPSASPSPSPSSS